MVNKKVLFGLSGISILIILFAAAKFVIHMLTASNYGYFCDEMYTIALSKHLSLGYVDLPPLVPALLALSRLIFGESLFAVHIVPALAGSATLVFVCLTAKELGGKLFAVGISALAFIIAPVWMTMNSFFAYDGFDQLILAIFLFVLIRLMRTGNKKLWAALGLIAGIAFMTKATILFLGPGFLAALLITKYRVHLKTRWPWLGAALFLLTVSPYLVWQYLNGWPTLEYWIIYGSSRVYNATFLEYIKNLIVIMNPLLLPVWLLGLYRIFRRFGDNDYRFLGIMFLSTLAVLFAFKAKAYMFAELFIPMIAAGSVFLEEKLPGAGRLKWPKAAITAYLVIGGLVVAPYSLPLLSPAALTAYSNVSGIITNSVKFDNLPKVTFPQTLADRFGWDNMVRTVAEVYESLPPEERKECGIYANWFGQAGAIDLLGPQYGLPKAVCGHLTYYLWGPGKSSWNVMIAISSRDELCNYFEEVKPAAMVYSDYTMPYNTNLPVYVCKKPKLSVEEIWRRAKHFD